MAKYVAFNFDLLSSSKVYRSHMEANDAAKQLNASAKQGKYFPVRINPQMSPEQCAAGLKLALAEGQRTTPPVFGDDEDLYA